jgi:hypothetical protein
VTASAAVEHLPVAAATAAEAAEEAHGPAQGMYNMLGMSVSAAADTHLPAAAAAAEVGSCPAQALHNTLAQHQVLPSRPPAALPLWVLTGRLPEEAHALIQVSR